MVVILLVSAGACSRFPTKEQHERYAHIQQQLRKGGNAGWATDDSAALLANDARTLPLDVFIQKYRLTEKNLDQVLFSLSITGELIDARQRLDQKLRESQHVFDRARQGTDSLLRINRSTGISFESLRPSDIKRGYCIQNGDTVRIRVMTYDSSYMEEQEKN